MKSPAFSFYVRDWMCSRKVASMSGDAVKAYMYLLCEAWLQEPRATLPIDDFELAEMARVSSDKWSTIKDAVLRCFEVGECDKHKGRYYNERQLEVSNLSETRTLSRKNKTKTKKKQKKKKPLTSTQPSLEIENEIENEDVFSSFSLYLEEEQKSYQKITTDNEWLEEQQKYHPNLNIKLSLEKAHKLFWGTEAGWKHKKKKGGKSKKIDWRRTWANALDMKSNQVYQSRQVKPDIQDELRRQMQRDLEVHKDEL